MRITTRLSIALTVTAAIEAVLFFFVFQKIVIPNELEAITNQSRDVARYLQLVVPQLSLSEQQNLLEQLQKTQPDLSYLLIIDRNGKALVHSNPARVGMVFDDPGSLRGARENQLFEQVYTRDVNIVSSPYHGQRTYDILVPYLERDVQRGAINVGISLKRFDAAKAVYYRVFLFSVFVLLIVFAIIAFVFKVYIVFPTRELVAATQQIQAGRFDLKLVSSRRGDEFGVIAREFQAMVQKTGEFIATISAKTRELREFIDHITAFVGKISPDGRLLVINQTAIQSLPGEKKTIFGQELWNLPWFSGETSLLVKKHVLGAAAGKAARFEVSGALTIPGQRVFSVSLSPVFNEDHAVTDIIVEAFDITERKADEAKLIDLNRELEEANASKEQFLAILSHELRNPLTPIIAAAELLQRLVPVTEAKTQRLLTIIRQNAFLQSRLVNDLLDLSGISRGKMTFQQAPVDLREVIRASLERVLPDVQNASVVLIVEELPEVWVKGDSDRLQQAMVNLLGNAIKFTPAGGKIVTQLQVRGPYAEIKVSDTGIGISDDLLPHVFKMFQQGQSTGKGRGGMGIGLALLKQIVERHGGRVKAESAGQGKGSCFTVQLPMIEVRKIGPKPDASAEVGKLSKKILFVEDNPDARMLIAEQLSLRGCDVVQAETAEEALKLLDASPVDCILSDIGLPGMDGYEFMRRVREDPRYQQIPAFAVTGFGQDSDVQKAEAAGYDGHFMKPIDISVLIAKISTFFRSTS